MMFSTIVSGNSDGLTTLIVQHFGQWGEYCVTQLQIGQIEETWFNPENNHLGFNSPHES